MQTIEHAVIAAAGLGSRLGHGKPKCLVEVGGRRILEYQLELLEHVRDVRLVVGYMEHEVMEAALKIRRDITLVRNPSYRTTTTQQSYWLGSRYIEGPCVYLDGDIIFERESFNRFLALAADNAPLIAVTEAKTEQAVFAATVPAAGSFMNVTGFSRTERSCWEWANLACLRAGMLEQNGGNVFERLARFLPLHAMAIECSEVDTEDDLSLAEAFVTQMRAETNSSKIARLVA